MKKVLVLDYDETLLKAIRDCRLVIKTDSLDQVEQKFGEAQRCNSVVAMCIQLPYTSISQIDFKEGLTHVPLIIYAFDIGDYNVFLSKVNTIRALNIRIFLCNKADSVFTDLKILASVGIDCGLYMDKGVKMDDESFLDLASYYFMSPVPHATIEPFDFILRHLEEEKNEGFESVYFDNPLHFFKVNSADDLTRIVFDEQDDFVLRMSVYYKHFMDLDDCSKCPAFKICDRKMSNRLGDCQKTMTEIFEYAELCNNMNHQQNFQKTVCQL